MSVKLLTEHDLEFLRFKGGCTGPSKSTLFKIPHCLKSHVAALIMTSVCENGEESGQIVRMRRLLMSFHR